MRAAAPAAVPALIAALLLAACSNAPPLVTASGTPPPPAYAVDGEGAAASEVRRQLQARGLYAADSARVIRAGFAAAPRGLGVCGASDPAAPGACSGWIDAPQPGWSPFAPPLRYRLQLEVAGTASITVTQAGDKKAAPLPAMVSAAVERLAPR